MDNIKKQTLDLILDIQKMSKNANKLNSNNNNIKRLKRRSIAELVEDRFAEYIYDVLNDKNIEIYINGNIKGIRPDIIIIKKNIVIGIIEIKIDFGWCRNIFEPKVNNNYIYEIKNSQIHERFRKYKEIKEKQIEFNDGTTNKKITISPKCKLYYISTSEENYIKGRKMQEDFIHFIKENHKYKNNVYFYVLSEKYHYDQNNKKWPNRNELLESIDSLFETEFGINRIFNNIKEVSKNIR